MSAYEAKDYATAAIHFKKAQDFGYKNAGNYLKQILSSDSIQSEQDNERLMRIVRIQLFLRSHGIDWGDDSQEQIRDMLDFLGEYYGIKTNDLKYEDFERDWSGCIPNELDKKSRSILSGANPTMDNARKNDSFNERVDLGNGIVLEMVKVEHGTFTMGKLSNDSDADDDEPPHRVTLTNDYWLGKYEVTQKQWRAVMGSNPSFFKGDVFPVECVSWDDVQEFCNKLNAKYSGKLPSGYEFRLPTEAEWEYASKGGKKSNGYKYSGSNSIGDVAWYVDNFGGKTHEVGTKKENELGLYDMSGNVWEWCYDWYGEYSSGSQTDPIGSNTGSGLVFRGGCWGSLSKGCRSSDRYSLAPSGRTSFLGFRLALAPAPLR